MHFSLDESGGGLFIEGEDGEKVKHPKEVGRRKLFAIGFGLDGRVYKQRMDAKQPLTLRRE
jgi:hypothetical protein